MKDLAREYETLRVHCEKMKKTALELAEERQSLDQARHSLTNETEILTAQLNTEKPVHRTQKSDAMTKSEIFEVQTAIRLIKEARSKKAALETQYNEEQGLWKAERKRLSQLLQAEKEKNFVMKQSIEQFSGYLEDKTPEVSVQVNPDSRLHKALSPISQKQVPQTSVDFSSDSDSLSEEAVFTDQIARFSSPIKQRPKTSPKPSAKVEPKPMMPRPHAESPEARFNFDYWPTGPNRPSQDGREIHFDSGDVMLKCGKGARKVRHGTMEIVRLDNGDVEVRLNDGSVGYRFEETGDIEMTLPDGTRHCVFANGQREIFFPDGDKYLIAPNKWTRYTRANGDYQLRNADGRVETCVNGVVSRA
jgi:hypothetical protein